MMTLRHQLTWSLLLGVALALAVVWPAKALPGDVVTAEEWAGQVAVYRRPCFKVVTIPYDQGTMTLVIQAEGERPLPMGMVAVIGSNGKVEEGLFCKWNPWTWTLTIDGKRNMIEVR